jgi:transcriptional regulator with XRE-family HTH domain
MMIEESRAVPKAATLLRRLRKERRVSKRQLADEAGVNVSVVLRAERGVDARLSTWEKLFEGLGWILTLNIEEQCDEASDLLTREAGRRDQRRRDGLCAGKRRFY